MAFKLTYTDGQESEYDDDTKWEVEGGVLKLGRGAGEWSVFVSPGHWATIEVAKDTKEKKDDNGDKDDGDKDEKDEKGDKDEKDKDEKDKDSD